MNLPNKICIARIVMCPVFFYLFISGNYLASAILYLIAASTDWLDGYIARKYNLVTDLGKFLDPIADKILVLSGMLIAIFLGWGGKITVWSAFFILTREFIVTGFRCLAAGKNCVIAADMWGKVKTVVQDVAIFVMLVEYAVFETCYSVYLLAVSAILAVISAVNYIYKNKEVLK